MEPAGIYLFHLAANDSPRLCTCFYKITEKLEEKMKKLKDDLARRQEQLNKLAERVREVE